MGSYLRPESIEEAVTALRAGCRTVLAGGTDFYPARVGLPLDDDILDISAIGGLGDILGDESGVRIGALVRWADLAHADLPPAFDGLKAAALQIGGAQVQNAGTVCGNVCNASPAADGMPNLLVLDASVELTSEDGVRSLPVAEFVIGNRETAIRPDELVTALTVPPLPGSARGVFLKLGARRYLVISIAMVSVLLVPAADGTVAEARAAVGACSPVARRLPALETALAGRPLGPELGAVPLANHLSPLSPIGDVRSSAEYRLDAALTLLRRALAELGGAMA
jgi:CO/xanthine dehydrogenase FAD-binding subunit